MDDLKHLIDLNYLEKAVKAVKTYTDDKVDVLKSNVNSSIEDTTSKVSSLSREVESLKRKGECECEVVDDIDFQSMLDTVFAEIVLGTTMLTPDDLESSVRLDYDEEKDRIMFVVQAHLTLPEEFDTTAFEEAKVGLFTNRKTTVPEYEVEDSDLVIGNSIFEADETDCKVGRGMQRSYAEPELSNYSYGLVARGYFTGKYKGKTITVYGNVARARYKDLFVKDYPTLVENNGIELESSYINDSVLSVNYRYSLFKVADSAEVGILYSQNEDDYELTLESQCSKSKTSVEITDFNTPLTVKDTGKDIPNTGNGVRVRGYLTLHMGNKTETVYTEEKYFANSLFKGSVEESAIDDYD